MNKSKGNFYLSNSTISEIEIRDADIELGAFRMGFPTPILKTGSVSSSAVNNAMSADASVTLKTIRIEGKIPK